MKCATIQTCVNLGCVYAGDAQCSNAPRVASNAQTPAPMPCIEAMSQAMSASADALRNAGWAAWTMLPMGQPERERLHRALAAYDAAKKGESNDAR